MKQIFFTFTLFLAITTISYGQFELNGGGPPSAPSDNVVRSGQVGIGFSAPVVTANYPNPSIARFVVRNGILAHYGDNGIVGDLNNSIWAGLGFGNPGAGPNGPYGLAVTRAGSVGFFNLITNPVTPGNGNNLIAGFGNAGGAALNRFIVRSYDNAATNVLGKDLLIANPLGAISLFRDPAGTPADPNVSLYVDGRQSAATFQDIFIQNRNATAFSPNLQTFSAIGKIGNANAQPFVAADGFRSQTSDGNNPAQFSGVAVNLQTLAGPQFPLISDVAIAAGVPREAAELSWQDLDYPGFVSTSCVDLPQQVAEGLDKFFISFRNNVNVNPFFAPNRLRVMTFQGNGRVGIGTDQPNSGCPDKPTLLDVRGIIASNGNTVTSDRRFKQDIKPLNGAMDLVRQLQGTTYTFRRDEFPDRNFATGRQFGFIAQDVEKVLPEVASAYEDGYYAVNYTMLIPILTEAIKEQDETITKQTAEINTMRTEIAELRSQFNDFKAGQATNGVQGFRLEQNTPNPFSESTVIGYQVPTGTVGAKVSVYDLTGRTVKTWSITDAEGTVKINAGELNSGLYIYDLQVNGRQILERKMTVAAKN